MLINLNQAPHHGHNRLWFPATVSGASYAGVLSGPALASADSNNNLNSSFVFKLNQATALDFSFDIDAFLSVFVSSDEEFPGFATAAYDMSFSIINLR